jgi:hypothetical protein
MNIHLQTKAPSDSQEHSTTHAPTHKPNNLATRLFSIGLAGFMFASCSRQKPILTDIEELKGPQGTELVDQRVALNVTAKFLKEVDDSYWYQPPPITIINGNSISTIPQVGYWIEDTDYLYSATVESQDKQPLCLGTIKNDNQVAEGNSIFIAKFIGIDAEGNLDFCGPELISLEALAAELKE